MHYFYNKPEIGLRSGQLELEDYNGRDAVWVKVAICVRVNRQRQKGRARARCSTIGSRDQFCLGFSDDTCFFVPAQALLLKED
jgi:hypothetical protein